MRGWSAPLGISCSTFGPGGQHEALRPTPALSPKGPKQVTKSTETLVCTCNLFLAADPGRTFLTAVLCVAVLEGGAFQRKAVFSSFPASVSLVGCHGIWASLSLPGRQLRRCSRSHPTCTDEPNPLSWAPLSGKGPARCAHLRCVRKLPLTCPEPSQPGVGQDMPSVLTDFQENWEPLRYPSFCLLAAKGQPEALRWEAYFPVMWPWPSQPGTGHLRADGQTHFTAWLSRTWRHHLVG